MGGSNAMDNQVDLTAREHFVCHLLLRKMVSGANKRTAWMAVQAMTMQAPWQVREYRITARLFEELRSKMPPESDGTREKKRQSAIGRLHTEETKKKMAETRKKIFRENAEYKQQCLDRLRASAIGRVVRQETRDKISAAGKAKTRRVWTLISPTGEVHTTNRLLAFCSGNGLCYNALLESSKSGNPVPPRQRKRAQKTSIARTVTTGWKLL